MINTVDEVGRNGGAGGSGGGGRREGWRLVVEL